MDGFVTRTIAAWVNRDAAGNHAIHGKGAAGNVGVFRVLTANTVRYNADWSTTDGSWVTTTATAPPNELHHVAVTYDGGSILNLPIIYIDGVAALLTVSAAPAGTLVDDSGNSLLQGLDVANANDMDGRQGWFCYANAIWTAEQINRARWWGTPGGAFAVYHPLVTDKLANEGTATANGTATGTTMASLPRVERNWGSLMGVGR